MRNKKTNGDLSVQAIAGTHVVLLGIDFPQQNCPGLLGFALRREDHTEGEKYWLSGYKTFKTVEPFPPPGMLYSTRQHPIQGFTWSDFSAKPEHDYTYEVFALTGTPANPEEADNVAVKIRTESEHGRTHHVHFNRGAAASQEYTRLFGDKRPDEVGPAAFTWLSRGAAESIADFVGRAVGPGWGLRVGAYEFTDETALKALGAARDRDADVEVLYHAKDDEQKIANETAIQKFGLENICFPRVAQGLAVLLSDVVNGADVRVVQCGSGLGLAFEPLQSLRVRSQELRQQLKSDQTPQLEILSLIHHSHATSTDGFENPVMRDGRALQERCGRLRFISGHGFGHDGHGWCIQDALRRGSMPDEGFNFIEQTLIFSTCFL